jgi:hypothetical protein
MLKNIEIKEVFDKICNCHTCFVKLPIVTVLLVATILFLSGCSPKVSNGWKIITDPTSYSVLLRPDGSIVSIIKSQ